MPSTYTTNLGIEKIATGEQSGTWGTTTNTNFDLIDTAVNGIVSITLASAGTSGSPNDLPITDGTASNGRNKFIEFVDGGDLGATAYVQLTPNDAEKIVHIRNSLSGSRSIIVFQGTYNASNDFEIPNGADVTLKFDGAGTGATVTDVNVDLTVTGVTATSTASFSGATIDDLGTVTTADINGGTIDGTAIGGSSAAAGTFTTFTSTGIDDNATSTKLTVSDSGIDVTGTVTSDGLTVDSSNPVFQGGNVNLDIIDTNAGGSKSIRFKDSTNTENGRIVSTDGDDISIYTTSAVTKRLEVDGPTGDISFYEDTGTTQAFFWDASAESLGIGETSPARTLDVNAGTSNVVARFASTDFTAGLVLEDDNGTPDSVILNCEAGAFTIDVGGGDNGASATEAMRIDSNGNVGIGTTSPAKPLFIFTQSGGNTTTPLVLQNNQTTANTAVEIRLAPSTQPNDIGSTARWSAIKAENTGTGQATELSFWTNASSTDPVERMRIDSSGNVGIGVSSLVTGSSRRILQVSTGADGGQIAFADSTTEAANPRIFATNKSDLKLASANSGASTIQFITGTTTPAERMRIDSSGNLLVGTTDVDHYATSTNEGMSFRADFGGLIASTRSNNYSGVFNRIGTDGDILNLRKDGATVGSIGTGSGNAYFASAEFGIKPTSVGLLSTNTTGGAQVGVHDIGSSTYRWKDLYLSGNADVTGQVVSSDSFKLTANVSTPTGNTMFRPDSNTLAFGTNSIERMRIDSSGNLLVGCTSQPDASNFGGFINPIGQFRSSRNSTASSTQFSFNNPNGEVGTIVTSGSATAYNTSSDQRLKENIVDAPAGNIDAIRVRSFDWKADGTHQTYGMVAQELVDVAPEAVSQGATEDDMWGVDYSKLVPMMIKEIQDLKAEVAALKGA